MNNCGELLTVYEFIKIARKSNVITNCVLLHLVDRFRKKKATRCVFMELRKTVDESACTGTEIQSSTNSQ